MATSKKTKIDGYFFMSICNGEIDVNCSGDENVLSAAFATLLLDETKEGKQAKQLLAVAAGIAAHEMQSKEKYSSKKSKTVPKTPTKAPKKK
jgi:hypothetical protein